MTVMSHLDFDEWVTFVFDHPVTDPQWYWSADFDLGDAQINLQYCTRLFDAPAFLAERYSQAQLNQAFWFIAGEEGSSLMSNLGNRRVPRTVRKACAASIYSLFAKLFDAACSDTLSAYDQEPRLRLNSACYMWWDIFPTSGHPDGKDRWLDEILLDVMRQTLDLPSRACRESALHGLGHWHLSYPREVEAIIDEFLEVQGEKLDLSLRRYAQAAREGCVQ